MENTTTAQAETRWSVHRSQCEDVYNNEEHYCIEDDNEHLLIAEIEGGLSDEAYAKAILMASAPHLLEACQTQLENWEMVLSGEWEIDKEGVQLAINNLKHVISRAQ